MRVSFEVFNLIRDGDFSLGIVGQRSAMYGNKLDEVTYEPLSDDVYHVGEVFILSIGLFFFEINFFLNERINEEPTKIERNSDDTKS